MAVTLVGSGSQTAVISTEHFLSSPNVAGLFGMQVDLVNMAAGDVVELRVYKMTIGSGTQRVTAMTSFAGVQPADALIAMSQPIPNTLTDTNATRFSLKQTFGTGRVFPWAVLNLEDYATTPQGVNVLQWNSTNVASPATAGIPDVNVKNYNNQAAQTDAQNLPKVDVEDFGGTAGAFSSGQPGVIVITNNDKTGYSVTGLTASNLDTTVSSRATPAQVLTQVETALNVDTYAQPGQGAPPATATVIQMLAYMFKAWRNRTTQTASQYTLYNDDSATVDQKSTFSDNGTTADRSKIGTGP